MSFKIVFLVAAAAAATGFVFGYVLRWMISVTKSGSVEIEVKKTFLDAKEKVQKTIAEAERKSGDIIKEAEKTARQKEEDLKRTEDRLIKKEEVLDKRHTDLDNSVEQVRQKIDEIKNIKAKTEELERSKKIELEKVAGMPKEEALKILMNQVESDFENDILVKMRKLEMFGREKIERRAKEIITTAIHRYGNAVGSDVTTTTVSLPSDDAKGRIIGKEGRNIKAFERASGAEVIVDDTPGVITLSCFDPVRRQIARLALENLIMDGRIQPSRIEETVEKAGHEINRIIKEKGEQAVYECGVFNIDPKLVSILGRLYFRTSYGQNVLQHSVEMAHIAGMIAEELKANVAVAKTGALFHDIGKALDHEVQGTHVEIGRRILQKFNVAPAIIQAMQSHHEEYPYETIESVIVQIVDSISASRPGARRDTVESYLKRLGDLENIANSFEGIEKAYALQAGREIRVFVKSDKISDLEAYKLAHDIALRIENDLKYPGEIKVTVIRETRVVEVAR